VNDSAVVSEAFEKALLDFLDKTVIVHEKAWSYTSLDGEEHSGISFEPDDNDPTLREVESLARAEGLRVRVWLPNTVGTCDYCTDRLNVHIDQGYGDGPIWRIISMGIG
jgi:hypothetical protein